ncbi:MAG: hypothetical protein V4689_18860 [Verrucomicrobiota bacterium]
MIETILLQFLRSILCSGSSNRAFTIAGLVMSLGETSAETVKIMDYFYPLSEEAEWTYIQQTDEGLDASKVKCTPGRPITAFAIQNGKLIAVSKRVAWLSHFGGNFQDGNIKIRNNPQWYEYYGTGDQYTIFGADNSTTNTYFRFAPEVAFPEKFQIPQASSITTRLFGTEGQKGPVTTITASLIEKQSVTVPAGTFTDCLHFRFTTSFKGGPTSSSEEWWAKGVGIVKTKTSSDDGKVNLGKLYSFKTIYNPTLDFVQTKGDFGYVYVLSSYPMVTRTFHVKNKGKANVPGLTISISGSRAFTTEATVGTWLAPGESAAIDVTFSTTVRSLHRAVLKVAAQDNPANSVELHIHGTGT